MFVNFIDFKVDKGKFKNSKVSLFGEERSLSLEAIVTTICVLLENSVACFYNLFLGVCEVFNCLSGKCKAICQCFLCCENLKGTYGFRWRPTPTLSQF